jgi:aminopeptidase
MPDLRTVRMADVIVNYSANIQPGDRVLIEAETDARPLVRALYESILSAGGHPHLLLSFSGQISMTGLDELFMEKANPDQLDYVNPFFEQVYNEFESRVRIHSMSNTKALMNANPDNMARRQRALQPLLKSQFERGGRGEFKWVTTLFPTKAYAQDAEMSLEEYEDFVYNACQVSDPDADPVALWKQVHAQQENVVDAFKGRKDVVVKGPSCDLSLSIEDRLFLNASGENNMPDGEVFTGPVEDSVNGWIRFDYPSMLRGNEVEGVELKFENGKVVQATAEKNQEFLDQMLSVDAGARYVGEFAIGNNYGVTRHTGNILFDEKIGGTIHLALGAGYPDTGSVNESAIHWDMICGMQKDAEIRVDGDVVYKDGKFTL